jgi:hypothetical protein
VYKVGNYLDADKPFRDVSGRVMSATTASFRPATTPGEPPKSTAWAACGTRIGICRSCRRRPQNGGNDWSGAAFSQKLGLYITPYAVNNVAHDRGEGSNGLRAPGQYQTGGVLALDAATGALKWRYHGGFDQAHGQTPLVTASDLVFFGQPDGLLRALDAVAGKRFGSSRWAQAAAKVRRRT